MKRLALILLLFLLIPAGRTLFAQTEAAARQDILRMVEEEKMARDVYRQLGVKWPLPIFQNIARSEQMHLDLMKGLVAQNGLTMPSTVELDETGVFNNRDLQQLYDQLVADGAASQVAALRAGALVEETDIRDLQTALSRTTDAGSRSVYERLLNASEHHLRAFVRNLSANGETYTPVILPAAEVDRITAATGPAGNQPMSAMGKSNGKGKGKSKNKGQCGGCGGPCCQN